MSVRLIIFNLPFVIWSICIDIATSAFCFPMKECSNVIRLFGNIHLSYSMRKWVLPFTCINKPFWIHKFGRVANPFVIVGTRLKRRQLFHYLQYILTIYGWFFGSRIRNILLNISWHSIRGRVWTESIYVGILAGSWWILRTALTLSHWQIKFNDSTNVTLYYQLSLVSTIICPRQVILIQELIWRIFKSTLLWSHLAQSCRTCTVLNY